MLQNNQSGLPREAGIAQLFVVLLLLAGIALATYLVQSRQIFKSRASSGPISGPITPSPSPSPLPSPLTSEPLKALYGGNPPTTWAPSQTQTYYIKVVNAGTETWKKDGVNAINLSIHFSTVPSEYWCGVCSTSSSDRVLALPTDLAPGQTASIPVTLTAPNTVGDNYYLHHRVLKQGIKWFDESLIVSAQIGENGIRRASYSSNPIIKALPNSTIRIPIIVNNVGTSKWLANSPNPTSNGFPLNETHLATFISTNYLNDPNLWQTALKQALNKLPQDVSPGGSAKLSVSIQTPSVRGSYFIHYRMLEQGVAWFNQYQTTTLIVN